VSLLTRTLGIPGAALIGLASMIGTGIFAAWSPAYSLAGSALFISLFIAASIAALNAISNARMARIFPQSGGGYVYGKKCLGSSAALIAGFSFVIGKTASASAAALVIGAYLTPDHSRLVAVLAVLVVLALNLRGIKYSLIAMAMSVSIVVSIIMSLIIFSQVNESLPVTAALSPEPTLMSIFAAAGILFVAFAGYARISVIAGDVKRPGFVIPWAIGISLTLVLALYLCVARILLNVPQTLESPASLQKLATISDYPAWLIQIAVVFAASSALFALNLGIGRMIFAMAKDGPLPSALAVLSGSRMVPLRAEILTGVVVLVMSVFGGIGLNLAVSGLFVLCYYAVVQFASMTSKGNLLIRWVIPIVGLCVMMLVIGSLVLSALG
jgi:APA family basic amino acid/polyamine antiporter